jgi:hypothetical protein
LRVIDNIFIVFMYSAGKRTVTEGYEKRKRELEERESEEETHKKAKLEKNEDEKEPSPEQEENEDEKQPSPEQEENKDEKKTTSEPEENTTSQADEGSSVWSYTARTDSYVGGSPRAADGEPSQGQQENTTSQADEGSSVWSYTARTDSYVGGSPTAAEIATIADIVAQLPPVVQPEEDGLSDTDSDAPLESRSRPAESSQPGQPGPSQTAPAPSQTVAGPSQTVAGPSQTVAGPSQTVAGPSQPGLMIPTERRTIFGHILVLPRYITEAVQPLPPSSETPPPLSNDNIASPPASEIGTPEPNNQMPPGENHNFMMED